MISDAIIYHLYQYHLTGLVLHILAAGAFKQVIVLSPLEYLIASFIILFIFCLESLLAYWLWHRFQSAKDYHGRLIATVLVGCLLISYAIYFGANYLSAHPKIASIEQQVDDHLVRMEAQAIPYYTQVLSSIDDKFYSSSSMETNDGFDIQNSEASQPLQYPLQPLQFSVPKHRMNIVVIAIDTWRYDMMNSVVTPNIDAFAQSAINFTDNYSGGNSTQPGIFSLFYSLPAPYWSAMLHQHRGPVFIQQLLKENYQLEVLGSAELNYPPFDKTVFRDVPNLQIDIPGNDPATRDANMTKQFDAFLQHRHSQQPFFGFLFYDAVHGYCEDGTTFPKPFQPAVAQCDRIDLSNSTNPLPYRNRYKNAVLYDDALIGQVLKTLKEKNLLKNTVVIITADHGEEFNDEHLDYWGHASAFDPYQVRTPLIVYWPGKAGETVYYKTSHYDVVPTLMKQALGVASPASSYSVGHSLFSDQSSPYLIVGSYVNYAILQPNRTSIIYSGGDYNITYPDGSDLPRTTLNPALMKKVYKELNRYYQ